MRRGTQFSTLNSAGMNDPEGPEKYSNTELLKVIHASYVGQYLAV
jgi:hypothetical protein